MIPFPGIGINKDRAGLGIDDPFGVREEREGT
jgi:hypothetical protein